MALGLTDWIETHVKPARQIPPRRLSEEFFFRDPLRPMYSDNHYFFSPADGVILYQKIVAPDEAVVDLKGTAYTLREALRDPTYAKESLIIGIFMTLYDVHVNRIPFAGRLSYRWLPPLETHNHPMLDVELRLFEELKISVGEGRYLRSNERVLNRIFAPDLRMSYSLVQLADYDVRCITPFELRQNWPCAQNQRFSQVRFGSQVDLIVPLSESFEFTPILQPGMHVEAGLDPLISIS